LGSRRRPSPGLGHDPRHPLRGIVDLVTTDGTVVDIKTAGRKPSGLAADHALQLATYTALLEGASGHGRLDTLVATKEPQLVQIEHTPEKRRKACRAHVSAGRRGIAGGLYLPNRSSKVCSRRHCPFADACEREFGGFVG
jgi:hypothetical protein